MMDNKPRSRTNWIFEIDIYGTNSLLLSQEPDKIPDSLQATVEVLQRPGVPKGINPGDKLGAIGFLDQELPSGSLL